MKSFRSKPVGWRNDSYRHSLAARGYLSKKKVSNAITYVKAPKSAAYEFYGIDSKGRRVRLYGKEHSEAAAKAKFNRIDRLNKKYQQIESKLKQDIDAKDDDKRENARATYVILKTGLRPGSYTDTKGDVKAFGLTTLKNKDVTVRKNTAEFKFIGKKGVEIEKKVTDPTVARIVKSQKKIGNKELFPNITDDSVRGYVQKFGKFKPKDFRTLYANMVAKKLVKQGLPKKEVVQKVAVELQNTPGVAAGSYIDPKVLR